MDTGAAVSLVSRRTWEEKWNKPLESTSIILTTYTEARLKVLGKATVSIKYNGQGTELPLIVVDGDGPSRCGRNWLQVIRLDWSQLKLNRVETDTPTLEKILDVHGKLFESGV